MLTRLPALPHDGPPADDAVVADFAEQFAVDVSMLTGQRTEMSKPLGARMFGVATHTCVADYVPRVRAGPAALGLPPDPDGWDRAGEPVDLLLNGFAPLVGARRALDPVLTAVVRLRGAVQHNCRLCRSLREGAALDAGGSESMYDDIEQYEQSSLLEERQKAALRYVDALICMPSRIEPDVATGVRRHFTDVGRSSRPSTSCATRRTRSPSHRPRTPRGWPRVRSAMCWVSTANPSTADSYGTVETHVGRR